MAFNKPKLRKGLEAVASPRGWRHPITNELLVSYKNLDKKIAMLEGKDADITAFVQPVAEPKVEAPVVEAAPPKPVAKKATVKKAAAKTEAAKPVAKKATVKKAAKKAQEPENSES